MIEFRLISNECIAVEERTSGDQSPISTLSFPIGTSFTIKTDGETMIIQPSNDGIDLSYISDSDSSSS